MCSCLEMVLCDVMGDVLVFVWPVDHHHHRRTTPQQTYRNLIGAWVDGIARTHGPLIYPPSHHAVDCGHGCRVVVFHGLFKQCAI